MDEGPLPPQCAQAEQELIGMMLTDEKHAWEARAMLTAGDFYDTSYSQAFQELLGRMDAGEEASLATICPRLAAKVPSAAELLVACMEVAGLSARSPQALCKLVSGASKARRMILAGERGLALLRAPGALHEDTARAAASAWLEASEDQEHAEIVPIAQGIARFRERRASGKGPGGICMGFRSLEDAGVTLKPGELTVAAGRPSMGKSAFAVCLARNIAVKSGIPTLFFSLETDEDQLTENLVCCTGPVDHDSIRLGGEKLQGAEADCAMAPLFIDTRARLTADDVRATVRVAVASQGVKLVILDYLQFLMPAPGKKNQSREREVADMSATLKHIARENKIPVVILCQLNRAVESRMDTVGGEKLQGIPRLSDLRDSGSIEQDADTALLLWRRGYYDKSADGEGQEVKVIIAKNRNGPTGRASLSFYPRSTSFQDDMWLPSEPTTRTPSSGLPDLD